MSRTVRLCQVGTAAVLFVLLGYVAAKIASYPANGPKIWDDGFFFVRYAANFWGGHGFSWNPTEPPVYGATSQAYLLLITLLHPLMGRNSVLTLTVASHLDGLLMAAGVLAAYWIASARRHPSTTWGVILFGSVYLCGSLDFWGHSESGMDTTLAAALVAFTAALYLHWDRRGLSRVAVAILPLVGLLLYLTRPDLGLFSLIMPAAIAWWHPDATSRRRAYGVIGLTAAGFVVVLASFYAYYGTALPLSFYVKTLGVTAYGKEYVEHMSGVGREQLAHFLAYNSPLLLLAALGWKRLRPLTAAMRGLLLGAVLLCLYHWLVTLQIMAGYARFYFPCFPVVMLFGLRGLEVLLDRIRIAGLRTTRVLTTVNVTVVATVGLLAAYVLPWSSVERIVRYRLHEISTMRADHFDRTQALLYIADRRGDYWFRLGRLSLETPASCSLATTELGLPGVLNPQRRIFDLSGLNEPEMLAHRYSAAYLLETVRPDWLYMPYPDYVDWNVAIRTNPVFARDYELYDERYTKTLLGVALLKSSPCFEQMRRILREPSSH